MSPFTVHFLLNSSIWGNADYFLKNQRSALSRVILADLENVNILKLCNFTENGNISFSLLKLLTQDANDFSHFKYVSRIMKSIDFAFYMSMHVYIYIYILIPADIPVICLKACVCSGWFLSNMFHSNRTQYRLSYILVI